MFALTISRVRAILAALVLTLVACLAAPAQAAPTAHQAMETSAKRILELIKDPGYVNPATRKPLRRQIEDEVYHIFDFGEFSMRTVGQRWKTFTPQQKKDFSQAFAELLLSTYLSKIDGYNGEQMTFTGDRSNSKGDRVEVGTQLKMKDGKAIPVAYRMMAKNGGWYCYDVIVEGVSLVQNYRTQFGEILNSASPDELITRVRTKAIEAKNGK